MKQDNYEHKARKRFGQNFLVDTNVIQHIVDCIGAKETDNLVEIGPGKGAITALILSNNPSITLNLVELDRDLIPLLHSQFSNYSRLSIHQADALKFDYSQLSSNNPLRIIGNLPYNISTPLIFRLLELGTRVSDMHFMLQLEVVKRLAAQPGNKNYGRLGVITQYYCEVEHLFDVAPECFQPIPKVNSAIVRLKPRQTFPIKANSTHQFSLLVKTAFQQRRKTLRNALKLLNTQVDIKTLDFDLSRRAETVSVEEYVSLSNQLWPEGD